MIAQPAAHRWHLILKRLILPSEIIPRHKDGPHAYMVLEPLTATDRTEFRRTSERQSLST